jgi:hypothetical protein
VRFCVWFDRKVWAIFPSFSPTNRDFEQFGQI